MLSNPKQKAAYTVDETCEEENFSRSTFYKLVRSGQLKARKVGRKTIVLAEDRAAYRASLPTLQSRKAA